MSAKLPPPQQEEVERLLRDCFKNGDISSVAAWLGRDVSSLSRQLNYEEPEQSDIYRAMRFLDACQRVRPELFEDVAGVLLDFITSRRQLSRPSASFSVKDLTAAINAYFEQAAYSEQLSATRRAIATLQAREAELMMKDLEDSPDSLQGGRVTEFKHARA